MREKGLSNTRQKIFQFIRDFLDEHGYAPTVRDIVKGCSLSSTAVVQHHLNVLEREGHIRRDPEVFRSIRLTGSRNLVNVPLLGTIAAGQPIPVPSADTWASEVLETVALSEELARGKDIFALRVKGQSMVDALIDDGDIVLIEPAASASPGDMVAVWLKEQQAVTLKKIYPEKDRVCLMPANRQMMPVYHPADNIEVQGRVVGVLRKL